jgi:ATP-dependent helicase IRC3
MEYNRVDRLWTSLYYTYPLFKSQYDACVNRLLDANRRGASPAESGPLPGIKVEQYLATEISEEIRLQVFDRDSKVCLCCGCSNRRFLQVDHISPVYHGGSNILDNLQTLCKACNLEKGTKTINFRDPQTDLTSPPAHFPEVKPPSSNKAGDPQEWEQFLRRTFNLFYQCGAVHRVIIGKRGKYFHEWLVELRPGHELEWLGSNLDILVQRVNNAKEKAGLKGIDTITVTLP